MPLVADIGLEVFKRGGGALGMGVRALGTARKLGRAVAGIFKARKVARPGIGSAVTKGPLKLGGKVIYGTKAGVSTAAKVAAAVGAGGAGLAAVASHRRFGSQRMAGNSPAPRSSPSPAPRAARAPAPTRDDRKCCPKGTKRVVCFKRGKVKKESRATAKARAYREKVRARAKKAKAKAKEKAAAKRQRAAARRARKALKRVIRRR